MSHAATSSATSSATAGYAAGRAAKASRPICVHCGLPVPAARRAGREASRQFCCFGCRFAHELARPTTDEDRGTAVPSITGTLVLRLGLGIFLGMNIMLFSSVAYAREFFSPEAMGQPYEPLVALFAYLLMFLCTVVLVVLGFPLAGDALDTLRYSTRTGSGRGAKIDANLLICIGVGAAYAMSVVHTIRGQGSLYFDTAAMVLVIVTLGQYIEAGAKQRATAVARSLIARLPARAWARRGDSLVELETSAVREGDELRVRPGESVPVDGSVFDGRSRVDESSMTGEPQPRSVTTGDRVLAGTINLDGVLWFTAERVGEDTTVGRIQQLLEAARTRQPTIQRAADRVAAWFVPGVVLLALGLFGWHALGGRPTEGLFTALTVLLISCPCALGLAAPLATWCALRRAANHGILIDSGATLEKAGAVRRLLFDKTGTLGDPRLKLSGCDFDPDVSQRQAFEWAAGLESASLHPIAAALVDEARNRGWRPADVESSGVLPGLGVEGVIAGRRLRLGSHRLVAGATDPLAEETAESTTVAYLADEDKVLARFELAEVPRDDALETVERLRRSGVETSVITGDRHGPARRLAAGLGLDVESELLPDDKLRRVEAARARFGPVAVVGDGINDSPVLGVADVGIAVASAADMAKQAGNVLLLADRLDRVPLTLEMGRHTMRRIRLSLAWAFGYNTVGILLAAMGWLTPIFAASAMLVSSLVVVLASRGAGRLSEMA